MEERRAIDRLHEDWLKFFHEGDGVGIASLYTDDVISLPPGADAIESKEGLVAIFTKLFEFAGGKGLGTDFSIISFEVAGNYIYVTGDYKLFANEDKKFIQSACHLVIFKKVEGKWLYHRDLWCENGLIPPEDS